MVLGHPLVYILDGNTYEGSVLHRFGANDTALVHHATAERHGTSIAGCQKVKKNLSAVQVVLFGYFNATFNDEWNELNVAVIVHDDLTRPKAHDFTHFSNFLLEPSFGYLREILVQNGGNISSFEGHSSCSPAV